MSDKEHKEYIRKIKSYSSMLQKSEEKARNFFEAAGIYTKSGQLTEAYSDVKPTKK